jgi:hypothetical protein
MRVGKFACDPLGEIDLADAKETVFAHSHDAGEAFDRMRLLD